MKAAESILSEIIAAIADDMRRQPITGQRPKVYLTETAYITRGTDARPELTLEVAGGRLHLWLYPAAYPARSGARELLVFEPQLQQPERLLALIRRVGPHCTLPWVQRIQATDAPEALSLLRAELTMRELASWREI